jgi:hypothetical protein
MRKWLLETLRFLHENEDGFFGIGEGPNSGEKTQAGELGALSNFATSTGEGDIGMASNFWKSILSGDPAAISRVLGPQISGINKRGQESKKTTAEFGNRGGGTDAAMQMTDDNTRSSVDSLISGYTGEAAGALGSLGSNLLSTGLSGHEATFDAQKVIHDQQLAKWNDLFKSIEQVAAGVTGL